MFSKLSQMDIRDMLFSVWSDVLYMYNLCIG